MSKHITIDPLTRIEGHLSVSTEAEKVSSHSDAPLRVTKAMCEGEMFRGFEKIMEGRDPLDAQQITQRICGVCPISHATASIRAQEMAYGITPNKNGRIIQNLVLAANYLQSHIIHFYHLSALDFVDITSVLQYKGKDKILRDLKAWVERSLASKEIFPAAPFLPRYEVPYIQDEQINWELVSHYVQALDMRRICHEMGAVFGAKLPHSTSLVPGGCTQVPTIERVLSYVSRLKKVSSFVDDVYIPDLIRVAQEFPQYWAIGKGYTNMLSYGVFPLDDKGNKLIGEGVLCDGTWQQLDQEMINEQVKYSWFSSPTGKHPFQGEVNPAPRKSGAYSWIKAPRYRGMPMEVGPLSRVMVNYNAPGDPWIKKEVDSVLEPLGIPVEKMVSVIGRHLARGLEGKWIVQQAFKWLEEIEIDAPPARDFDIPGTAAGYGLTEAPRGALGHWLTLDNHKVKKYQCVVPTTWNCSPRDDNGQPGPIEKALEGVIVDDPAQPIEVARIVRSYDPCLACAVH